MEVSEAEEEGARMIAFAKLKCNSEVMLKPGLCNGSKHSALKKIKASAFLPLNQNEMILENLIAESESQYRSYKTEALIARCSDDGTIEGVLELD